MSHDHGGSIVGEVLAAHGVRCLYNLCGGHISPILLGAKQHGLEVVNLRHRLSTHQRDLKREPEEHVGFGMSAETLLRRVSSGLRVAKDVLAAVRLDLFAQLEQAWSASDLADRRQLNPEALAQVLSRLASLGLLLKAGETYRNSEAASRFLRSGEPEYIGLQLEELVARADRYDPLADLRSR